MWVQTKLMFQYTRFVLTVKVTKLGDWTLFRVCGNLSFYGLWQQIILRILSHCTEFGNLV